MTEFQVGQLLFNQTGQTLCRVISTGENSLTVIEYSQEVSEPLIFSLVEGLYYKWIGGAGEKVALKNVGKIAPNKIPQHVISFSQLDGATTFIIKGVAYKLAETNSLTVPENWAGRKIFYLVGKKDALLGLVILERKSLMDKHSNCDMSVDGAIVRLKETDVWLIVQQ